MSQNRAYDVVVALNYYTPYVSGVTEAARVTAEGLAARGWRVLVVCGRHDRSTPRRETINGVDVLRTRVAASIGKGIISPWFVPAVVRRARKARLLHVHAPILEAGALVTGVGDTPVVLTYQCDVSLPKGGFNAFQENRLDASHRRAMKRADAVAVTSHDYAEHSRLSDAMAGKTFEVPAPSLLRSGGAPTYRDGDGLHVGFLGRIVEEKGLEYLVEGFRKLGPDARLIVGGDFSKVAGGSVVERVRAAIGDDPRVRLLGFVPDEDVPDFYASIDVFALPSVNSLEAFGIVQVEAMMLGVPSLASDLPGVRRPVQQTGFGRIVAPRDAQGITNALKEMGSTTWDTEAGAGKSRALFLANTVVDQHEELFIRLTGYSPVTAT